MRPSDYDLQLVRCRALGRLIAGPDSTEARRRPTPHGSNSLQREKLRADAQGRSSWTPCSSARATNVALPDRFTGDSSALLVTRDRAVIVSDGRFTTQLEQECPGLEASHPAGRPADEPGDRRRSSASWASRRLGFEAAALSVADLRWRSRKALPAVDLVAATEPGRGACGQIKDEGEIAAIREAIAVRRAGLRDAPGRPAAGATGEGRRRRAGGLPAAVRGDRRRASRRSWPSGPASALPHARPTADDPDRRRRLRADRLGGDRPALQK